MIVLPLSAQSFTQTAIQACNPYFVFKVLLALASLSTTFLPSESSYGYPVWGVPRTNTLCIISDERERIKLFL